MTTVSGNNAHYWRAEKYAGGTGDRKQMGPPFLTSIPKADEAHAAHRPGEGGRRGRAQQNHFTGQHILAPLPPPPQGNVTLKPSDDPIAP